MMNRNRKIALVLFIITFLAAVWLLKCSDTEQAPVKDPTEERRNINPGDMDADTSFVWGTKVKLGRYYKQVSFNSFKIDNDYDHGSGDSTEAIIYLPGKKLYRVPSLKLPSLVGPNRYHEPDFTLPYDSDSDYKSEIEWLGYLITASDSCESCFRISRGIQIGLRNDGTVVWRKIEK